MKHTYRKNWFTVVELVVVMTVLILLATLSFLTVSGYPKDSRDATRLSNLNDIKSIIDLHVSKTWEYPAPNNASFEVDESWVVWAVWEFGSWVISQLDTVRHLPLEPDTKKPYKYSLSKDGRTYRVTTFLEWKEEEFFVTNTMKEAHPDAITCTDLPLSWVDKLNSTFAGTSVTTPKTKAEWCSLKVIQIVNESVGYLPKEFFYLTNLTTVQLSNADLGEIPADIKNLRNLTSLDIRGNWLPGIPAEIGELKKLKHLNLGYNAGITSLPEEIGNLKNLEAIWLDHTRLNWWLPTSFSNLESLNYVSMYTSCVEEFPKELLDLSNLTYLVLNRDITYPSCPSIPSLPDWLADKTKLKGINFSWHHLLWGVAYFMDFDHTWPFTQSYVTDDWRDMTFTWNPTRKAFDITIN